MGSHPGVVEVVAPLLLQRLQALVAAGERPVVGLNGPVGAGKSTLCRTLVDLAPGFGLRLGVASIDDFYLPFQERCRALAGNPFGVSRVPPGSHDVALLIGALEGWREAGIFQRPCFDKRLRGGQGDRAGFLSLACDALLLEGWMIGCRPLQLPPAALARRLEASIPELTAAEQRWLPHWDAALMAYGPVWERLSALWVLRPTSWRWPRRWRFQAEARQRRSARAAAPDGEASGWLDGRQLEQLVRASLCSLPPSLYQDPLLLEPSGGDGGVAEMATPPLAGVAWLDSQRRCVRLRAWPDRTVGVG